MNKPGKYSVLYNKIKKACDDIISDDNTANVYSFQFILYGRPFRLAYKWGLRYLHLYMDVWQLHQKDFYFNDEKSFLFGLENMLRALAIHNLNNEYIIRFEKGESVHNLMLKRTAEYEKISKIIEDFSNSFIQNEK